MAAANKQIFCLIVLNREFLLSDCGLGKNLLLTF
jgi:hypothetical protein